MPQTVVSTIMFARIALLLGLGLTAATARAEQPPPAAAIGGPVNERRPFAPRGEASKRSHEAPGNSSGWWMGTAGIAAALFVCGAVSVASRRYVPRASQGLVRVIGRTSLSPKHSVYLLQVADRVLIVGAGPQGAPSLLGELDDFGESPSPTDARPAPNRSGAKPPHRAASGHIDLRLGNDV
jgi:flagellar protein FliO/FliZ